MPITLLPTYKSQLKLMPDFLNPSKETSFTHNISSVYQLGKMAPTREKTFAEMSNDEREAKLYVAKKIAEQVNKIQLPKLPTLFPKLSYSLKADILPSSIISQPKTEPAKPLERKKPISN